MNTHEDIDSWIAQARQDPAKVSDLIKEALSKYPNFYKNVQGLSDALQDVANTKPSGVASALGSKLMPILSGSLGAGVGSYFGSPLIGSLTGALTGLGGVAVSAAARASRAAATTAALRAAQHLNATGVKLPPSAFYRGNAITGPLGAAAQQSTPGYVAGGAWATPPQQPLP